MKVLITGGAGYIGYSLLDSLVSCPEIAEIVVYDNFHNKQYGAFISGLFRNKIIKVVQGDILDRISLKKELQGVHVVVHFAAIASTPFATMDHHQYDQVNNWGTAQVVEACRESNIKQFIYSSSTGVYGHRDSPASESDKPTPDSFYGLSKLSGEKHVTTLESIADFYIFRIGSVYGENPCMKMDGVIHKFLFNATVYGRISIDGNGHQKRPFIHVKSLAHIIQLVILGKIIPGKIENLFAEIVSINQIAEDLKRVKPDLDIIYVNQDQQFGNLILQQNGGIDFFLDDAVKSLNIAGFFADYFLN